jgi:hypothetical protein
MKAHDGFMTAHDGFVTAHDDSWRLMMIHDGSRRLCGGL